VEVAAGKHGFPRVVDWITYGLSREALTVGKRGKRIFASGGAVTTQAVQAVAGVGIVERELVCQRPCPRTTPPRTSHLWMLQSP
jgi:hypothetical protein